MGDAVSANGKPLIAHTMVESNPATDALHANAIPTFGAIDAAVRSLSHASRLQSAGRECRPTTPRTEPVGAGYLPAQKLLREAGIRFPGSVTVHDRTGLAAAVERLTAPYVLKASWLEHKSEVGGVRVGIADHAELVSAFDEMYAALGDGDYVVEELDTRPDTVEILLGARRDPDLGAVVVVGAGGTEAEVYRDVTVELAPVDPATALRMIERLICLPLLRGWRGKPAVDIDGLATAVAAVSELAAAHPRVDEIEVNPLRVGPDGVLAVDALVIEQHPEPIPLVPKERLMTAPDIRAEFTDRVAVVTGGGSGIGRAIATRWAAAGGTVAVLGRREEALAETVALAERAGGTGIAVTCDVRDPAAVDAAIDSVVERTGRLDALVNNAAGNFVVPGENLSRTAGRPSSTSCSTAPSTAQGPRPGTCSLPGPARFSTSLPPMRGTAIQAPCTAPPPRRVWSR